MRPRSLSWKLMVCALPFIAAVAALALRPLILAAAQFLPACPFYQLLRLPCPACGNTRAVLALLQGDVIASVKWNIVPLVLLAVAVLLYVQLAFHVFGKRVRLLPPRVFLPVILLTAAYFVLRMMLWQR